MSHTPTQLDLVGLKEIADDYGISLYTVRAWSYNGKLPDPQGTVSGNPAWERKTIEAWLDARKSAKVEKAAADSGQYPVAAGGGWFVLSDGSKVQGAEKAVEAQAQLTAAA